MQTKAIECKNGAYITQPEKISFLAGAFPSLFFYCGFLYIIWKASRKARRGIYNDAEWYMSSYDVFHRLEKVGVDFHITGLENFLNVEGPCIVVGNHMSMMETVILPIILSSAKRLTYVIKESLLSYPVFKHVMRSRDPIAVTRTNPRQDFKTVMEQGMARLGNGISIIVFPQTTRALTFDPEQMNSIGVKLAKKAGVPIIPLALQTSAWGNGKMIKDLGKIDSAKKVYFAFDAPLMVKGKGGEEHEMIIEFIQAKLKEWERLSSETSV
jgi:1-acyl-sn-glycerol-3-phosphate acyltransferase